MTRFAGGTGILRCDEIGDLPGATSSISIAGNVVMAIVTTGGMTTTTTTVNIIVKISTAMVVMTGVVNGTDSAIQRCKAQAGPNFSGRLPL